MADLEYVYARDIYGRTLLELGAKDQRIVVLDADLSGSTRTAFFAQQFPERFFNMGVAEQNMMATAAGLASCGKIVFVSTFAMFATARALDQVRNTICYNNFDIKIVATHGGITVGPDGSSHQANEDIALMRCIPNMKILVPCDGPETRQAIFIAYNTPGPFYVRLGRPKVPTVSGKKDFQLGEGYVLKEGKDITFICCGIMVWQALLACEILEKEGISCRLVNMPTLKPLDEEVVIDCAKKTQAIITCEEHTIMGGLGSAVAEVVCGYNLRVPLKRIGIKDKFGQSGEPSELLKEYGLDAENLCKEARALLNAI